MKTKTNPLRRCGWLSLLAAVAVVSAPTAYAATVDAYNTNNPDPNAGGIGYEFGVTMSGEDEGVFSSHVGAWSWQDSSLFNPDEGETPVGWTHTANFVAVDLTAPAVFTVKIERKADVPWPGGGNANRVAGTAQMFPSFTIWQGWDNDNAPQAFADANNGGTPLGEWHTFNNRGDVEWAEDLSFVAFLDNSTADAVQRTYILPAGKYTLAIGSHAPATSPERQGYQATFTTSQILPPAVNDDSYFTRNGHDPILVTASAGFLANDVNVSANYTLELVRPPKYGALELNADGSFNYTPGAYLGVNGGDSFTYRMIPAGGVASPVGPATVSIGTFASNAGRYSGLLYGADGAAPAGHVRFVVNALGSLTGQIAVGAKRVAVKGTVTPDGKVTLRGNTGGLTLEAKLLAEAGGARFVEAAVTAAGNMVEGRIDQSPFSRVAMAPMKGLHQVTLVPESTGPGLPARNGRGTLRIAADGAATLTGRLGDNTPFSISSSLIVGTQAGPTLPVFSALYAKRAGQFSGNLTFGASALSQATGTLQVVRPAQARGIYQEGFVLDYAATTAKR